MKLDRLAVALSLANLIFLAVSTATADPTVVRARAFELIDGQGVVRGEFATEANGAVLLRLIDQRGNIRVKLGAGDEGSGLLLADDQTEVGVHILSGISLLTGERSTMITLAEPGGARRVIRPGEAPPNDKREPRDGRGARVSGEIGEKSEEPSLAAHDAVKVAAATPQPRIPAMHRIHGGCGDEQSKREPRRPDGRGAQVQEENGEIRKAVARRPSPG